MDTPYLVNAQGYGLLAFMVTDSCGRGRPVFFSLLSSENFDVVGKVVDALKLANSTEKTGTVVLDKDFVSVPVVREKFQGAAVSFMR